MRRYAVIMAGGGGTRFWPLSRAKRPKQFLSIQGDDLLINATIKRLKNIIPEEHIFIITNRSQHELMKEHVLDVISRDNIIYEPEGKNTAAAIAYAATYIKDRIGEGIMCVFPSDHHITEIKKFEKTINTAIDAAHTTRKLYTIGVKPTFCATGFGYVRYHPKTDKIIDGAYEVAEFIEKPEIERAKSFCTNPDYLWNSGIFVWKISTIISNIERYLPKLYRGILEISNHVGKDNYEDVVKEVYSKLPDISIDYAIMERSEDVWVVPGDFGWNDIGTWDSFGTIYPPDENNNIIKAKHVEIDTTNSIIYGNKRLIATIDMDNVIIAETEDALLVCNKDRAQDVRELVEMMKEKGLNEFI